MSDVIALGKQCPDCNSDKWVVSNEPKYYIEICNVCGCMNEIKKQDFIDNFVCSKCNCLEGILEENKKYIAIRCKHCDFQKILLEKHTTIEHTQEEIDKTISSFNKTYTPHCPTCNSSQIRKISVTSKAINIGLFGIFGNKRKKQFHCDNCGYEW